MAKNPITEIREIRLACEDWDEAISAADGPQLVVGGPGSGKTEFLVRRIVRLINTETARADQVQLLTFSRRAAADARDRIIGGIDRSVTSIGCSTFHSLALRLLETFRPSLEFELLTGPEQVSMVAQLLSDEEPKDWPADLRSILSSQTMAADVADFLMRCGERTLDDASVAALGFPEWRALPALMRRYQEALTTAERLDYAQLLLRAIETAREPDVSARLAQQFRYVLADEYQDTSPAQADFLHALCHGHRNITAAGDPYQSVYSFRGADLANIEKFPTRFTDAQGSPAKRIVLTTSRRVPPEILSAAVAVTEQGELPGAAGPVFPAQHRGSVEAYVFDQSSAEADWIAAEIARTHLVEKLPYTEMAVLVRSKRTILPELSRALGRHRIPHDIPDARLVDHPAIQLVFDLVQISASDSDGYDPDVDRAVRRLLLGPALETPLGRERALFRLRRRTGRSWNSILSEALPDASGLLSLLGRSGWTDEVCAADGFWEAWSLVLAPLALESHHAASRQAWTSFAQVLERQRERDKSVTLRGFWESTLTEDFEASPLISFHTAKEALVLTTLHQAKGLEFDTVFIADADDATFPDLRRGNSMLGVHRLSGLNAPTEVTRFRVQEEMRLAYTAMCRARRRVIWTATAAGIDEGDRKPSRFLLSVAGVADRSLIGPPPPQPANPTTLHQLEVWLRRTLVDPGESPARRLAAAAVLAQSFNPTEFAGVALPGPDTGIVGTAPTLSPSQAESYARCPRRYVFERRLGIGNTTSSYAHFGTLIHRVLEELERERLHGSTEPLTLDKATRILDQVWSDDADFGSPVLNIAHRDKAIQLLNRLIDEWPSDAHRPIKVEHGLELMIADTRWVGRADRIDEPEPGVLRIVDHKTSKNPPSAAAAATSLQLGFYLLAAQSDGELAKLGHPEQAEFWYPASKLVDFRKRLDPSNLEGIRERLVEIGNGIKGENWDPIASAECERCPVQLVCPLWPEGTEAFAS